MKKLFLLLLIPGLCLLSCKHHSADPPAANAYLEVIYACNPPLLSSATGNLSVLSVVVSDGDPIGLGGQVVPADVMDMAIPAENDGIIFSVLSDTANTQFAEWQLNAAAGAHYGAFFGGPAGNPCKLFFQDTIPAADPARPLIRFIDLSSDPYTFTCYYNDTAITTGLVYQQVTPFFAVTPCGNPADSVITLKLENTADTTVSVTLTSLYFVPGGIYSIILCGNYRNYPLGLMLYEYHNNQPHPL